MESVLTLGLVSVILGTASGAQNIGVFGAIGVGAYIALAGLWGSPISGASMNPARTFGPDLVGANFTDYWVYVAGPLFGALLAVGAAFVLRGRGGGRAGSGAAQGALQHGGQEPRQAMSPSWRWDARVCAEGGIGDATADERSHERPIEGLRPGRAAIALEPRPPWPTRPRRSAPPVGRQPGRRFLVRATRAGIRPRTAGSRWICSRSRRRRGFPSSCRSGTAGCSRRPLPSIEERPTSWPRTSPPRRDRGSASRSAATRTSRTSACSAPPSGSCSSTSTTSTRPSPVRGSGT